MSLPRFNSIKKIRMASLTAVKRVAIYWLLKLGGTTVAIVPTKDDGVFIFK